MTILLSSIDVIENSPDKMFLVAAGNSHNLRQLYLDSRSSTHIDKTIKYPKYRPEKEEHDIGWCTLFFWAVDIGFKLSVNYPLLFRFNSTLSGIRVQSVYATLSGLLIG